MVTSAQSSIATVAFQRGSLRALLSICILLIVGNVMSGGWQVAIKSELGALELSSFVCLSFAALIGCSFHKSGLVRLWAIPYVFAFLALREMDFQNWWFDPGLLRTEIFSAPVPIWQKLVSASAMGVIAITLISLLVNGARPFLSALFQGDTWALILAASGVFVSLSLVLDGVEANLSAIGLTLAPAALTVASYMEEIMEFGFAFSLVAALVVFVRSQIDPHRRPLRTI
ncbi:hypothetical protein [Cognatishimia activa]|uniref:hypothetical protein n=1 Tax=Cognatishimia activa TaxID=1715691 RepID=UPI002230FFE8|nr:hypothetical protein [Cognatishimia activa]UZD89658.1 hypothetical protein M0D42_08595 [Cognatishimia activa]